ncbi:hypothetical protein EJ04DRAFT_570490 [Polyplosphaeria fusca]|uniref:Uncharacterized protein n=1 Tax=Polyplosphaeria fusca TaxID=682080 RepID=A0A9P4QKF3_9PLEO|nr:hypothetical protein EJ04DRAFT_570490 [Polyplosphaeria fusca]
MSAAMMAAAGANGSNATFPELSPGEKVTFAGTVIGAIAVVVVEFLIFLWVKSRFGKKNMSSNAPRSDALPSDAPPPYWSLHIDPPPPYSPPVGSMHVPFYQQAMGNYTRGDFSLAETSEMRGGFSPEETPYIRGDVSPEETPYMRGDVSPEETPDMRGCHIYEVQGYGGASGRAGYQVDAQQGRR